MDHLTGIDDVPQAQRRGTDTGAHEGPDSGADDEAEHLGDAGQADAAAEQPAQEDGDEHDLEGVPDGLTEDSA